MKNNSNTQKNLVTMFNRAYRVGDTVRVLKSTEMDVTFEAEIFGQAQILNGHSVVVWLKGHGCYSVLNVQNKVR